MRFTRHRNVVLLTMGILSTLFVWEGTANSDGVCIAAGATDVTFKPDAANESKSIESIRFLQSCLEVCKPFKEQFEAIDGLLKEGRWTEAEVAVHLIRAEVPECALVKLYLGRIQFYYKNDRKALSYFNHLAEHHPEICSTYHYRGLIFYERRLELMALTEFHKVLAINHTAGTGYFLRTILPILGKNGFLDPVRVDSLLHAVSVEPATDLTRGFLAWFDDNYDRALTYFKKVVASDPGHAGGWYYVARCYDALGESNRALDALNEAIAGNDSHAGAFLFRGIIKIDQGNWFGACRDFHKARSLDHYSANRFIRNYCRSIFY